MTDANKQPTVSVPADTVPKPAGKLKKPRRKREREPTPREIKYPRITLLYYIVLPVLLTLLALVFLDYTHGWRKLLDSIFTLRTGGIGLLIVLIAPYSLVKLAMCLASMAQVEISNKRIEESMKDYIRAKEGYSGCGKSTTGVYESKLLASLVNEKVRKKLWVLSQLDKRTEEQELEYMECKKAIDFYDAHPELIPFLVSNSPIWPDENDKRSSMELTMAMLTQDEPIPPYAVIFIDEVGDILDPKAFRAAAVVFVSEICKLLRHYGEWHIITCEQDSANTIINLRRNTAYVDNMQSQTSRLKPTFLILLQKLIARRAERSDYNWRAPKMARIYIVLDNLIKNMGFRVFRVHRYGGPEQPGQFSQDRTMILPASLNCQYNDRAYALGYMARNKPIAGKAWGGRYIPELSSQKYREFKIKSLSKKQPEKGKDRV